MGAAVSALTFAVRPRVVAKYLGQLAWTLMALTAVPLLVSLLYAEYRFAWRLAAVIVALLLCALPASRLPAPTHIQRNEALVVAALAFLLTPLAMIFPMRAAGLSVIDALFESVSGVTTTGLSILSHVSGQPHTLLFLRAWMQWYGGLGIVVLSLALLIGHHAAARRLAEPAVGESLATTARLHARRMLAVYTALTLGGYALLWASGLDAFSALTQVLAAVSTGGFSTFDNSLAGLAGWSQRFAVMLLALLGAVPLALYYRAVVQNWREGWRDLELRTLLLATLACSALLAWLLYRDHGGAFPGLIPQALLLGISAQSTTGFSAMPMTELGSGAKWVVILAMSIGGGLGSTAGGVKLLRLLVVLRFMQISLQRTALPEHAVVEPRLMGRPLESDDIVRAMELCLLFGAVVGLSWLAFLVYGYVPLDALFEVVSATGTVGLSTGITRPELEPALKLLLCLDMWLGRLEIVALLVLFYPRTWFGKRGEVT